MKEKRIILLRFHKKPLVVKNRIKLLRIFNPDLEIYGLYGGKPEDYKKFKKYLRKELVSIYKLKPKAKKWYWYNGDLALIDWYKDVGSKIDFDTLYLIEWDALFFKPLKEVYKNVPNGAIGLTAFRTIDESIKEKWYWVTKEPWKSFWMELMKRVEKKYGYNRKKQVTSIFGLPLFPKKFLKEYSKIKIETTKYKNITVPLCHDEIRLPLFADILGYKMVNNKILKEDPNREFEKYFNADNFLIELEAIKKELKKNGGRRVFHPYRKILDLELAKEVKNEIK